MARHWNFRRHGILWALVALLLLAVCPLGALAHERRPLDTANTPAIPPPAHLSVDADLDGGFSLLYDLKFAEARKHFVQWQQQHPDEALGPAMEAAADLFQEFYSAGILTSEFFRDDKQWTSGVPYRPDRDLDAGFFDAAKRSRERARQQLASNPREADALFALTLDSGMLANHASLLEKRQLEGLRLLRETDRNAQTLLAADPDAEDAYLSLGTANYIIGCMPAYKRAFLWFGGIHGDKTLGMQQLARVASRGHYLRAYAKLLLALAALRENNPSLARQELKQLAAEFPENPLYTLELSKLPQPQAERDESHAFR
jgi:hypothetical protein